MTYANPFIALLLVDIARLMTLLSHCDVTDITDLYHEICSADLNIAGESFNVKRTSLLRGNTLHVTKDGSAYRLLFSLQRSLTVSALLIYWQ